MARSHGFDHQEILDLIRECGQFMADGYELELVFAGVPVAADPVYGKPARAGVETKLKVAGYLYQGKQGRMDVAGVASGVTSNKAPLMALIDASNVTQTQILEASALTSGKLRYAMQYEIPITNRGRTIVHLLSLTPIR